MPRAASLAAVIKEKAGIPAAFEPGENGQFDVIADGELVFSKNKAGRFPEEQEILQALK